MLRSYDSGIMDALSAVACLLHRAVLEAIDEERPIWEAEQKDALLSPFTIEKLTLPQRTPSIPHDVKEADMHSTGLYGSRGTGSRSTTKSVGLSSTSGIDVRRFGSGKTPFHTDFSALQLGDCIGAGGYGEVFRGTFLMSPVAVKMFRMHLSFPSLERDSGFFSEEEQHVDASKLNRVSTSRALKMFASVKSQVKYHNFVREVELMSIVRHPNLVLYMGACGDPETPLCIVSELFIGGSFFDYLHADPSFRPDKSIAASFALCLARGMLYLHTSNPSILHRDLKS